ncbi:TraX family protein [Bifidobacterium olomucense]|uniref:ABC transporter permease n=1 Tax=Bifidobacterium olomucense TaxID=2675324 RepID=A0A7Y0EYP4_9BIFI|nr:TraX family protein [Bifidobacterium sp. DSM 109959]NMM98593.1 ABC transporter permease [Bifidobacterium sp. DSM 109959]
MNEIEMARQRKATGRDRRHKGLSVFRLKVIGAVFMALSIASTTLVPMLFGEPSADNMTGLTVAVICEIASWCAVPIYAWLLFDGWRHTRNVGRYWAGLFILAALAGIPYGKIMTGDWGVPFSIATGSSGSSGGSAASFWVSNPVWGLVLALLVLMAIDWLAKHYSGVVRWLLTVAVIVAGLLWNLIMRVGVSQRVMYTGAVTLAFVLIFYFLAPRENTMMFTAGLLGAVMCITPGVGVAFLHYRNGELGYKHSWTKWVFYALYPVMLLIGALL